MLTVRSPRKRGQIRISRGPAAAYYAAEGGNRGLSFEVVRLQAASGNQFGVEHECDGKMQLGQTRTVAG